MDDSVALKEYFEKVCCIRMQAMAERMDAHEREHELLADALGKAEAAVNQRLGAMNELRDQINTERGEYATKAMVKVETENLGTRVEAGRLAADAMQRSQANMEGRAWALAVAIPLLVSALASVAVKLL